MTFTFSCSEVGTGSTGFINLVYSASSLVPSVLFGENLSDPRSDFVGVFASGEKNVVPHSLSLLSLSLSLSLSLFCSAHACQEEIGRENPRGRLSQDPKIGQSVLESG